MKKILLVIMFILNIFSFSKEIPHKYIYENPNREVTTTETLKRKPNGSEMNISVTKIKSKKINAFLTKDNLFFVSINENEHENLIIINNYKNQLKKNYKKISYKKINNGILIKSEEIKDTFFIINKDKNIIYKVNKIRKRRADHYRTATLNIEIDNSYDQDYIKDLGGYRYGTSTGKGLKVTNNNGQIKFPIDWSVHHGIGGNGFVEMVGVNKLTVNSKVIFNHSSMFGSDFPTMNAQISNDLNIGLSRQQINKNYANLLVKFNKYPIGDSQIILKMDGIGTQRYSTGPGGGNFQDRPFNSYITLIININNKNKKIEGNSNLTFNENYNRGYLNFTSTTLSSANALSLENSVSGLTFNTTGAGVVGMAQNDILDINGTRITVGANGNISEREISVGSSRFKLKTENGKLRLALISWTSLDRPVLNLKVLKNGSEISVHRFNVVTPKKIEGSSTLTFNENYGRGYLNFSSTTLSSANALSLENSVSGLIFNTTGAGVVEMAQNDILDINGTRITVSANGTISEREISVDSSRFKIKTENGKLRLALISWTSLDRPVLNLKVLKNSNEISLHRFNVVTPKKIEGSSILKFKEYYNKKFVEFNSVDLNNPVSLTLENSLKDVFLESSTHSGIINMAQNDVLDINGTRITVGTNGNISEREISIGSLKIKIKVENGKLRLALINWGILESDKVLNLKVLKNGNEISIHNMTLKSPRKIEGSTVLKFTNEYLINSLIHFNAIDLYVLSDLNIDKIKGVNIEETRGNGIPLLKAKDMIFISDNNKNELSLEVDSSNSINYKKIKVINGEVGLKVENGKIRLSLINWIVNKNLNIKIRIVRGINEITNHNLILKLPEAPFQILQNGSLNFGTVISGMKNRKAEANIKIKMMKDVSDIKLKLNTETPEMTNDNGDKINAKNLKTYISKRSNSIYQIKILGELDVTENQKLGQYNGSAIVEMLIK